MFSAFFFSILQTLRQLPEFQQKRLSYLADEKVQDEKQDERKGEAGDWGDDVEDVSDDECDNITGSLVGSAERQGTGGGRFDTNDIAERPAGQSAR